MSRVILFGFNPDTNEPLDSRLVVETIAERDALNTQILYTGLITYVSTEDEYYRYDGTWKLLRTLTPEQVLDISQISSKSSVRSTVDANNFITALTINGETNTLVSGTQGEQGIQGDRGEKGDRGVQGATGTQGAQGVQGASGPSGVQGQIGLTGPQGQIGEQGIQGNVGNQGIQGNTGPAGPIGGQGPQGNDGLLNVNIFLSSATIPPQPSGGTYVVSTGVLTPPGTWIDNVPNPGVGEVVYQSLASINPNIGSDSIIPSWSAVFAVGSIGPAGPSGPAGNMGSTGPQGNDGPTGDQGIQGIQGIPGTQGDTGADGAQGEMGERGLQGFQGLTGGAGAPGVNGTNGADGQDGTDGANGVGVPVGGTTGQVLAKIDDTDYNTRWIVPTGGAGSGGAVLNTFTKLSDGTLQWDTYDVNDTESFNVSDFDEYTTLPGGVSYSLETNTDTINLIQTI